MKILFTLLMLLSFHSFASKSMKNYDPKHGQNLNIKKFVIDTQKSELKWTGRKPIEKHFGTVGIKSGYINYNGPEINGITVLVDMKSISVSKKDINDSKKRAKLEGHLKDDDFFGVNKHPLSSLVIHSVSMGKGGGYDLVGALVIKGIQKSISFPAEIQRKGKTLMATGKFKFDRTEYNIKYKSKSIFSDLGDKFIHDDVELEFKIIASAV